MASPCSNAMSSWHQPANGEKTGVVSDMYGKRASACNVGIIINVKDNEI